MDWGHEAPALTHPTTGLPAQPLAVAVPVGGHLAQQQRRLAVPVAHQQVVGGGQGDVAAPHSAQLQGGGVMRCAPRLSMWVGGCLLDAARKCPSRGHESGQMSRCHPARGRGAQAARACCA